MNAIPWIKELLWIKEKVQLHSKKEFNCVLLNFYRSGEDHISWHSDNESELGENPIIASISLGETRKFRVRNKKDKKLIFSFELENGSLLLMKGKTQTYWEHEISKNKKSVSERINLTFRLII